MMGLLDELCAGAAKRNDSEKVELIRALVCNSDMPITHESERKGNEAVEFVSIILDFLWGVAGVAFVFVTIALVATLIYLGESFLESRKWGDDFSFWTLKTVARVLLAIDCGLLCWFAIMHSWKTFMRIWKTFR